MVDTAKIEKCCDRLTDVVIDEGFEPTVACSALLAVLGQLVVRMGMSKQDLRDFADRAHDDATAYMGAPRGPFPLG